MDRTFIPWGYHLVGDQAADDVDPDFDYVEEDDDDGYLYC